MTPHPGTPAGTPTPSLRRRVVLAVLGWMALLLVLLGVSVDVVVGAQARRDLHDRLDATAARADALSQAGADPRELVAQLSGGGIAVRLVTPDGTSYGDLTVPVDAPGPPRGGPPPPPPSGMGPPGRPQRPPPPPPPDATTTVLAHPLPGGDRLIMVADTTATTRLLGQLRMAMLAAALVALVLAAAGVALVVRAALRPLDRLTTLATAITSGDRGRRLRPDRPSTELGRAALAFDEMLDELEASEARARRSADTAAHAEATTRRFLADAAHELRTPISGIQAGAEQMVGAASQHVDDPDHDRQRHRAALVLAEARSAGRLVADMLDLSRIDAGVQMHWQRCDLAALAEDVRARTAMLAPSVTVTRSGVATLPLVTDPGRVSQILTNLTDNARRHTPVGGSIVIDVGAAAGGAVVSVVDTGSGVPDDQRERIFERLVRLDESRTRDHGGAGLGLSIARGLAQALGGRLECLPSRSGAHFQLWLPAAPVG